MTTFHTNKKIETRGTIIAKELADVRDGLTPLQRDILAKVQEMTHEGKHRKTDSIIKQFEGSHYFDYCGCTVSGTAAKIYTSILIMTQQWKSNTLLHGKGNFGMPCLAYGGFAAPGYNEIKLSNYAESIFDTNQICLEEKAIFPALVPNVLISGTEGTLGSIPPHNLGEVIDATIAMIQKPDIPEDRLFDYIQGPDYTTGGIILNKSELPEIYRTGVGNIQVRAKVAIEHNDEENRDHLIISELPFTLISECRCQNSHFQNDFEDAVLDDFSFWNSGDYLRIEDKAACEMVCWDISLKKKGKSAKRIRDELFRLSRFEGNYEYRALLMSKGKPELMSLHKIISEWIEFYRETMTKKNGGVSPTNDEMIFELLIIKEQFATPRKTAIIDAQI